MPVRVYQPTSAGRRNSSVLDFSHLTKGKRREKSLTSRISDCAGHNVHGHITSRFRGGGARKIYRKVDFLRQKRDQPFFLAVGMAKPHLPFVSPKKYWDMYDPAKIELARNPYHAEDSPAYALTNSNELRNYSGIPNEGPMPDALARTLKHGYYAAISYTDAQIGKVLNELERLGLKDNTIIVLWGDHGWKLGEHGEWAKHSNVENDTNAPLLLSVPGMKKGIHTNALVEFVDVYPTLCDVAGIPIPSHVEGVSAKPLLSDPKRPWKTAAFSQYPRGKKVMGYSMRTDRYRLTVWLDYKDRARVDAVELYDHQADPEENRNIANLPANKQLVAGLMEQWKKGWQGAKPKV